MPSFFDNLEAKPSLDEKFYSLGHEELTFFKSQTGIEDENILKSHIIAVQAKAYELYTYSCIRRFAFTKLGISRLPSYDRVLKLGQEREGAVLLDVGCGFGSDTRKVVLDGFPVQNVVASDLFQGFWDLGHELFRSTPKSFPAHFVPGDVFDPTHLLPHSPLDKPHHIPLPPLSSLSSLTPLHGHLSVIHASLFFHLFSEEKQLELAKTFASLLSPLSGSMIFGSQSGKPTKGFRTEVISPGKNAQEMVCHSPESWRELWDGQVFKKGTVQVEAVLRETKRDDLELVPGSHEREIVQEIARNMSAIAARLKPIQTLSNCTGMFSVKEIYVLSNAFELLEGHR